MPPIALKFEKVRLLMTTLPPRTKKPRKEFEPLKVKLFPLIVIV